MDMTQALSEADYWSAEVDRFLPDPAQAVEEGMRYVCCPVCYVLARIPMNYFSIVSRRWSEEPQFREAVLRAGGYCNRHAWDFEEIQSSVVIARIMADVLDGYAEGRRVGEPCPVCHLQKLAENALLAAFLKWLERPGSGPRYESMLGICDRHYERLCSERLSDRAREMLVRHQQEKHRELVAELRAFVETDKTDARWARTEHERLAPQRALLKMVGSKGAQ
jgi:hypothetical protein